MISNARWVQERSKKFIAAPEAEGQTISIAIETWLSNIKVLHGYHNAPIRRKNLRWTTSTWMPFVERPILLVWIRDRNPFTELQPILFKCGEDLVVVGFRRNFSEFIPRLILYVDLHLYKNAHSLATCFFRHLQKNQNYINVEPENEFTPWATRQI